MRLESISVKNFRSITKAERLHLKSPTVILGANNEGKSNLLGALVMAMDMLMDRPRRMGRTYARPPSRALRAREYDWDRDFPVQLRDREPPPPTEFTLEFMLDDDESKEFQRQFTTRLSGSLPVKLSIPQTGRPKVTIAKQGPSNAALAGRADEIALFVAEKVDVQYIGAVRTAERSREVVASLISRELATLAGDPAYEKALAKIAELRKPILTRLGTALATSLQEFLPDVKAVRLELSDDFRRYATVDSAIYVDDGRETELSFKGDGVKSLAAIALAQHATTKSAQGRTMIVVIEEPESHLHSGAIHQLREVVLSLAERHQVVVSTHSALFADRTDPSHNIIVRDGRASPAKSLAEVREALGVRVSDNLINARLVLVVEGDHDLEALGALLPRLNPSIGAALSDGSLAFHVAGGAAKLDYTLRTLQRDICDYFVFFDGDTEGTEAVSRAVAANLLAESAYAFALVPGFKESELEDFFMPELVAAVLKSEFAVGDAALASAPKSLKFSARAKVAFAAAGKPYSNGIERKVKTAIAQEVVRQPGDALDPRHNSVLENLAERISELLDARP